MVRKVETPRDRTIVAVHRSGVLRVIRTVPDGVLHQEKYQGGEWHRCVSAMHESRLATMRGWRHTWTVLEGVTTDGAQASLS